MLGRVLVVLAFLCLPTDAHAQATDWMGLGDALVAGGAPDGLERALDAFGRVDPSGPDALRALERRAFVNFLLGRMTASVACYVPLLDRLARAHDTEPMRDEALMMLASILADPDWDRDGTPDASALARLSDATLIPPGRPWLAALYFATARSLYFTSRDPAAIAVFDAALERWPAPEHGTPIEGACRRHRARPTTLPGEDASERLATDAICTRRGF